MRFHKEGRFILILSTILLIGLTIPLSLILPIPLWSKSLISLIFFAVWLATIQFFRNPLRLITKENPKIVYAPADGTVVVLEETKETEVLQQNYIQLSIFMSPLNVHVNRHPVSGIIDYYKYHPGKYLMAWNPKASTDNERTTIVYTLTDGQKVLVRQIAGFMARRIACYAQEGKVALQGEELGFIRFGSRVDVYLPLTAKLHVKIGDKVVGNRTILAEI